MLAVVVQSLPSPPRVLIAGGGVAGLESALALRNLLGERVEITVLAPETEFVYRPMAIAKPFGRGDARRHRLADIADQVGFALRVGELLRVDDRSRSAVTTSGQTLSYDALIVAVGAESEPVFGSRTLTWTPEADSGIYGGLLADFEEGYSKRLAFVVPHHAHWPLPAYELALMTAWDLQAMGQDDVEIVIYTHEASPLEIFGASGSAALKADLEEAGVRVETSTRVSVGDNGHLVADPGGHDLRGQRVVALPRAAGRPIEGLQSDDRGFIPTDPFGRVAGTEAVWAAGDATAYPIKQGGLAAQQADVVAGSIAALAGAGVEPQPFQPVLRGVLLTGRGSAWMRHDLTAETDADTADRHALFWPPTKIAGRHLSPFLASLDGAEGDARPSGELVDIELADRSA